MESALFIGIGIASIGVGVASVANELRNKHETPRAWESGLPDLHAGLAGEMQAQTGTTR